MDKATKKTIRRAMDLLYDYFNSEYGKLSTSEIKEGLFTEFQEYNNGNSIYLFEEIEKRWDTE